MTEYFPHISPTQIGSIPHMGPTQIGSDMSPTQISYDTENDQPNSKTYAPSPPFTRHVPLCSSARVTRTFVCMYASISHVNTHHPHQHSPASHTFSSADKDRDGPLWNCGAIIGLTVREFGRRPTDCGVRGVTAGVVMGVS